MKFTSIIALVSTLALIDSTIAAPVPAGLALPNIPYPTKHCDQACNQTKALAMRAEAEKGCAIEQLGVGIPLAQCAKFGGKYVGMKCVGFDHAEQQAQCMGKVADWFSKAEAQIAALPK
jgi:hypothetical protein